MVDCLEGFGGVSFGGVLSLEEGFEVLKVIAISS